MGKVYVLPEGFKAPEFNWENTPQYEKDCADLTARLKDWCVKRNSEQECVGEVIHFPVADGRAEYMVAAIKPVELIHLPFWDGWNYEYAHRLTGSDVKLKVKQQNALNDLFSKKK